MFALPPSTRRGLERELRERTPWHVRVVVRSSAENTLVRTWSARWFAWQSSRSNAVLPGEDPLLFLVKAVCLDVQNFMRDETGRWWPTSEPVDGLADGAARFANPVLPYATRDGEQVLVEWRQGDRSLLTFDPLPVA